MDELDYFPAGAWPSGYASRPSYASPGAGRPGDGYHGAEQDNGVWQRQAAASGQPLGAPVDPQPYASWAPPEPAGDWPRDPLDSGYWPPAQAQRAAPGTGHLYTGTWPSPGYPPDAYYPPGAYDAALPDAREYAPYDGEPSYYDDPRDIRTSYDQAVGTGLPYQGDGPADAFAGRASRPNGGRPRRRALAETTSLLAGYQPEAAPARAPRTTERSTERSTERTGARASAHRAAPPAAAPGRTLPDWLPFGSRIVVLPKQAADDDEPREHRDVSGGSLRPAVFGAMDGLVTNSSLIAGIGAGGGGHGMIVLTGVAGLIAGAFSMATGEYISVKSQNELTQAEVDLERRQHVRDGAGKLAKLTQTFIGKGVSPNLAEAVARQISADPERAVTEHVREELGLDPDDLPSPRTAAIASMTSFTVGALIPLSPFLVGVPVLQVALALAGLSAYAGGAVVARLTGRPALLGGLRQFTAAFVATGMAFLIGHLVGAHVG